LSQLLDLSARERTAGSIGESGGVRGPRIVARNATWITHLSGSRVVGKEAKKE
jgi:hypothetical protein